jgi:putative holliday junction resolvase
MNKGKVLGIDYGDRRVGIAISDLDKSIAFPREFLTYVDFDDLLDQIEDLCTQESIFKIIIGLPIQMDGKVGRRAETTYAFGTKLASALPKVIVEYFDERLTTRSATEKLQSIGIKAKDQKGEKDAISAQVILQTYLEQK